MCVCARARARARVASQAALVEKNLPTNEGDVKRCRFNPWVGKSPGGRHGNLHQYSCLENPMDRGALGGYSPWG